VEKARQNYVTKSKERDKAEKGSKEKFSKIEKEANAAVAEYKKAISEWEKVQGRWIEDMRAAAKVLFLFRSAEMQGLTLPFLS